MKIYFVKHKEYMETFFTWDQAYRAYGEKVSKLNLESYAEWTGASDIDLKAQHADKLVELICLNV